jgi:hypothetical protein
MLPSPDEPGSDGMQHCGSFASQPVGHAVVPPPKQRMTPFVSALHTAFFPSQQFCEAFTAPEAPQMLPGGLQEPPLSQVLSVGSQWTHCDDGARWLMLQHDASESQ